MSEKEQLAKFLGEQLKDTHDQQRKILDELRRSRRARGGVGAPLEVPAHLRESSQIIVTDADLASVRTTE